MKLLSPAPCVALVLAVGCQGSIGPQEEPEDFADPDPSLPARNGPRGSSPPPGTTQAPGQNRPPDSPAPNAACEPPRARIWKLTPRQHARTIASLLGGTSPGPDDLAAALEATVSKRAGFSNDSAPLDLSEPHLAQLMTSARTVAASVSTAPALYPCTGAKAQDMACVRGFIESFGARAFRRPLEPDEVESYASFYRARLSASPPDAAARLLIRGMLMSPNFLFRTELGSGTPGAASALTPFERASALSYFLTDGPPDAELFAAARAGRLAGREDVEAHARRLVASPELATGVLRYLSELFEMENASHVAKDPAVYAAWSPALAQSLAREPELFVKEALWREDGKLATLLTAPFSVVDGRLAAHYGIQGKAASASFERTPLPPSRAGLLTQGGLLASLARDNDTDPVKRGKFIREQLLCSPPPPPPPEADISPPPPDGKRNQRERLAQHSASPACAGCHKLMDPLGLAFETFDGIGRHRDMDVGKPIDASGTLTAARPEGARFAGAVELARLLAGSPDVAACVVKRSLEYGQGRVPGAGDACTLRTLGDRFAASGGNLLDLMVAIAAEDALRERVTPM